MSLDVMHARVSFRRRAILDILDLALRFIAVNGTLYAKIAAVVLLPSIAVTLLAELAWGWIGAWIVAFVVSLLAQVPFTVLASRLVFQERVAARAVLRAAAREVPRILVMRIGWAVAVGLSLVLVVGPVWLGSLFLFVDEVMILERSRIGPAFGRSNRIVSSGFWHACRGMVMVAVVPVLAVLLADIGGRALLSELLQFRSPAPMWSAGGSVLAILGWFAIVPFATTARFFTYLDMRTRAEGWDIQTRFAAIAARSEQREAA